MDSLGTHFLSLDGARPADGTAAVVLALWRAAAVGRRGDERVQAGVLFGPPGPKNGCTAADTRAPWGRHGVWGLGGERQGSGGGAMSRRCCWAVPPAEGAGKPGGACRAATAASLAAACAPELHSPKPLEKSRARETCMNNAMWHAPGLCFNV